MASQQGKGEGKDQEILLLQRTVNQRGSMNGGRASDRVVVKTSLSLSREAVSARGLTRASLRLRSCSASDPHTGLPLEHWR